MKHKMIALIFSQWRHMDKGVRKKLMIGAGIFSAFVLVALVSLSLLLFKAGSLLLSQVQVQAPPIQMPSRAQIEAAAANPVAKTVELGKALTGEDCWQTLSGLISPEPWLSVPLAETFKRVQNSCLRPGA